MLGQATDPHIDPANVPGWENDVNFNRTHMYAASLGGSNTIPENFVAVHRHANFPVMYHYEGQAAKGVGTHGAIDYRTTAVYSYSGHGPMRPEDLRPIGITIHATSPDGKFQFVPYTGKDHARRQILHYDDNGRLNAVTVLNVPKCIP